MVWLIGYVLSERFRQSGRSKKKRDYILSFQGVSDMKSAIKLVGKEVEYREGSIKISGRILRTHGVKGKVRARFRKPLPGQFWRGRVYLPLDRTLLEFRDKLTSSQIA
ncbi:MAG: 50S ribosomal protein L35ae [Aigarchaeota archaeon]|nr:50S ribosomal protein L35ae [Aigarchaeota archaeon]MCX8192941.1 50S ribosomal protein L35ae [Nitrososphaeria archaeon]MDW7986414.1 50S ribosomal protein L35ae [Nitrososphaerota archaeon]